jgi:hypothetical protein
MHAHYTFTQFFQWPFIFKVVKCGGNFMFYHYTCLGTSSISMTRRKISTKIMRILSHIWVWSTRGCTIFWRYQICSLIDGDGLHKLLTFRIWAPRGHTIIFLKIPPTQFYLCTVSISDWNWMKTLLQPFSRNCIWSPCEAPLFLELECLYSRGNDLWWISLYIPNMNKIHPTIQMLARQTDRWHSKSHFFVFRGV